VCDATGDDHNTIAGTKKSSIEMEDH